VQHWSGLDKITLEVPLPLAQAGYFTVRLAVDPPCPQHFAPTLRCRSVQVDGLRFGDFLPDTLGEAVAFQRGLELAGYAVDSDSQTVRLWWRFGSSLSEADIRFVHVVDADGSLAAQDDRTLGAQPAGGEWVEQVTFADLSPGTYDVYAGWYTYPDFIRFGVLADVPGAADGWAHLGQIVVGNQGAS
jgi:hypothetical protein